MLVARKNKNVLECDCSRSCSSALHLPTRRNYYVGLQLHSERTAACAWQYEQILHFGSRNADGVIPMWCNRKLKVSGIALCVCKLHRVCRHHLMSFVTTDASRHPATPSPESPFYIARTLWRAPKRHGVWHGGV